MSNLVDHASRELNIILDRCNTEEEREMQEQISNHILELVKVFSDEGHSGSTAGYTVAMLQKLLRFEPLAPLIGDDDEWEDVGDSYQNKRCSHIFKDKKSGRAYDIDGRIFVEPSGASFTSSESRVDIEFPYTPKREYVYLEEGGGE